MTSIFTGYGSSDEAKKQAYESEANAAWYNKWSSAPRAKNPYGIYGTDPHGAQWEMSPNQGSANYDQYAAWNAAAGAREAADRKSFVDQWRTQNPYDESKYEAYGSSYGPNFYYGRRKSQETTSATQQPRGFDRALGYDSQGNDAASGTLGGYRPQQPKAPDMGAYQPRKTFWDYAQPQAPAQPSPSKPSPYDAYRPGRAQPIPPSPQGSPYGTPSATQAGSFSPNASQQPSRNAFIAEYFNPSGGYEHDAEFDKRLAGGDQQAFRDVESKVRNKMFSPDATMAQRDDASRRLLNETYTYDNQQRPTALKDYRYNGQSYALSQNDPFGIDVGKMYNDYVLARPGLGADAMPAGAAQPTPQGDPYGGQGLVNTGGISYGPGYEGNWRGRREADTTSTEPGYATTQRGNGPVQRTQSGQDGNWAYRPYDQRPQPFVARYNNFDGTASGQPNTNLRDAFVQQVNTAMMPYYSGRNQGRPQFNFQSLMSQARDMANNGWQNPFAPQRPTATPSLADYLAQFAPPDLYQPPAPPTAGAVTPPAPAYAPGGLI